MKRARKLNIAMSESALLSFSHCLKNLFRMYAHGVRNRRMPMIPVVTHRVSQLLSAPARE